MYLGCFDSAPELHHVPIEGLHCGGVTAVVCHAGQRVQTAADLQEQLCTPRDHLTAST